MVEAKIDDVDQVLWDLFKLATGLTMPGIAAAYMVVARSKRSWECGDCVDLFRPSSEPIRRNSAAMFKNWRRAWISLLSGGSARPLTVPEEIETMLLGRADAAGFEGYEVRLVSIRLVPSVGRLAFVGDWPVDA